MGRASIAVVACGLALACAEPRALTVDLRTDWVPAVEFAGVHVELEGEPGSAVDRLATPTDDYLRGWRVAELLDVPPGEVTVRVTLRRPESAGVLDARSVIVESTSARAITVVMARREGTCASARDCDAVADCAENACAEGACLAAAIPGACGPSEWCDPLGGCQPLRYEDAGVAADAGPPDAGPTDAGVDAGPECPDVTGLYDIMAPAPCEEIDGLEVDVERPDPASPCEVRFVPAPGGSIAGAATVTRAGLVDGRLDLAGVADLVACTGPFLDGSLDLFCRERTDCIVELRRR